MLRVGRDDGLYRERSRAAAREPRAGDPRTAGERTGTSMRCIYCENNSVHGSGLKFTDHKKEEFFVCQPCWTMMDDLFKTAISVFKRPSTVLCDNDITRMVP